jgi:class 3 adenylate cyclase
MIGMSRLFGSVVATSAGTRVDSCRSAPDRGGFVAGGAVLPRLGSRPTWSTGWCGAIQRSWGSEIGAHALRATAATNALVDKYIGDGIMAFWGPPFTGTGDHSGPACLDALDGRIISGFVRGTGIEQLSTNANPA